LEVNGNIAGIEDLESFGFKPEKDMTINLVIDRFSYEEDENFLQRLADSIQMAFYEGHGYCSLKNTDTGKSVNFPINLNWTESFSTNRMFIISVSTILTALARLAKVMEK
jgi:excinuclease UvrABC ATPase subunit